jgi:hypothetical protein
MVAGIKAVIDDYKGARRRAADARDHVSSLHDLENLTQRLLGVWRGISPRERN